MAWVNEQSTSLDVYGNNKLVSKSYSKVERMGALSFCLYASSIYVIHGWLDFHPSMSSGSSNQGTLKRECSAQSKQCARNTNAFFRIVNKDSPHLVKQLSSRLTENTVLHLKRVFKVFNFNLSMCEHSNQQNSKKNSSKF